MNRCGYQIREDKPVGGDTGEHDKTDYYGVIGHVDPGSIQDNLEAEYIEIRLAEYQGPDEIEFQECVQIKLMGSPEWHMSEQLPSAIAIDVDVLTECVGVLKKAVYG